MNWTKEIIPDTDRLYMRAHKVHIDEDGNLAPGVFRDQGDGMSTDWNKYATPQDTQIRAKVPGDNAIVSLSVGGVKNIPLDVQHSPLSDNRAHTDVIGDKKLKYPPPSVRIKLLRLVQWEIRI